jgi:hypothetical protein
MHGAARDAAGAERRQKPRLLAAEIEVMFAEIACCDFGQWN